jgi:large subunit ribosomal protein L10
MMEERMTATTAKEKPVHPPSANRVAKGEKIVDHGDDLKDVHTVVVVHQLGLNADETLDLRRKLRAAGVGLKVGKNKLVKHAIKGTKIAGIEKFLHGPTALAYSKDPIAPAKITVEFAKKNEKLKIIAAVMGDQILDAAQTKALASLPSLDELRGKLIGLLLAPATKIAGVLVAPAGQLARVMSARSKQAS